MGSILQVIETSERSVNVDQDFIRSYDRTYKVVTSDPNMGPRAILESLATDHSIFIQKFYETSTESDSAAIISSLTLKQDSSDEVGTVWVLTAQVAPWDPYRHNSSPLLVYPRVTLEGFQGTRLCQFDFQGHPLLNTCGDSYDPVPSQDEAHLNIRINQNLQTFDPSVILLYSNRINNDGDGGDGGSTKWFGLPPHTCKIEPPRASVEFHQTCGSYWSVEWTISVNLNWQILPSDGSLVIVGHDELIPSKGFRELIDGSFQQVLNPNGTALDQACYLDADGVALVPPILPDQIVYTLYQKYPSVNFTSIFGFTASGPGALFF